MRIDPHVLSKHLKAAAVEDTARDLRAGGYVVDLDAAAPDGFRPDLVARRDGETLVVEATVAGAGGGGGRAGRAAQYARDLGARFRLLVVQPGRETGARVEGLDAMLLAALSDPAHPDLRRVGARPVPGGVGQVEVEEITVRPGHGTEVAGSGRVWLTVEPEGVEVAQDEGDDLPFTFRLSLGPDGRLVAPPVVEVDTSPWETAPRTEGDAAVAHAAE